MEAGVVVRACGGAVRCGRGGEGGARQEGTSINDWAWTWAGWRRGGAATIGEHKNSPVKGSRLSGRVGLSLTESGQDGESDRDRAGNVVESSSRVLPTGSDQVEREKIVVVVAAVGHRLWLLIAVPERDGQVQGVRNGGRARRGGEDRQPAAKWAASSCFLRGEEKEKWASIFDASSPILRKKSK